LMILYKISMTLTSMERKH